MKRFLARFFPMEFTLPPSARGIFCPRTALDALTFKALGGVGTVENRRRLKFTVFLLILRVFSTDFSEYFLPIFMVAGRLDKSGFRA